VVECFFLLREREILALKFNYDVSLSLSGGGGWKNSENLSYALIREKKHIFPPTFLE
jgi:hypothetical protein